MQKLLFTESTSIARVWVHFHNCNLVHGIRQVSSGPPHHVSCNASQNVNGLQRKEKQGNTRAAISLDGAVSFPGAYFSQITLATSTKGKKRILVERIVIITITIIIICCLSYNNLVCLLFPTCVDVSTEGYYSGSVFVSKGGRRYLPLSCLVWLFPRC